MTKMKDYLQQVVVEEIQQQPEVQCSIKIFEKFPKKKIEHNLNT